MSNIDIAKKYTTRDGREVVIFEVSDKVYCKIKCLDGWALLSRSLNGMVVEFGKYNSGDLIHAKTWRAWRKNDAKPKFIITKNMANLRLDAHCFFQSDCDAELQVLFDHYSWIHEDGSETPCGVCE